MPYKDTLALVEFITVLVFAVEYVLRIWTAEYLYPKMGKRQAVWRYMTSFNGIIDMLAVLPYFLPIMFPAGVVAFRMFRIVRIFRLFRVNAFSGFWWSVSTLLTVGYGDIYPITNAGRIFGIIITFLGVGMAAIPTGILSGDQIVIGAEGFQDEVGIKLKEIILKKMHPWVGQAIRTLDISRQTLIVMVKREHKLLIPNGSLVLREGDMVLLYTNRPLKDSQEVDI